MSIVQLIDFPFLVNRRVSPVFGVDILDLNLGVQINSIKQPIKSNSVGSGYMSRCGTSAFDDHFNPGFVILKMYSIAPNREDIAFDGT